MYDVTLLLEKLEMIKELKNGDKSGISKIKGSYTEDEKKLSDML